MLYMCFPMCAWILSSNWMKPSNLHRQQYLGGVLVGNHIHKTLHAGISKNKYAQRAYWHGKHILDSVSWGEKEAKGVAIGITQSFQIFGLHTFCPQNIWPQTPVSYIKG